MPFFQRMKEARVSKNISQRKLADLVSVAPASISAYEKGSKVPPVEVAYRIANVLGVSLDWLCGRDTSSKMKTLGDVAQALLDACAALSEDPSIDAGFTIQRVEDKDFVDGKLVDGYTTRLQFDTSSPELTEFFDKLLHFQSILANESNVAELFQAWLASSMKKLYEIPVGSFTKAEEK